MKALQGIHLSRRTALALVLLVAASPFAIPVSSGAADPTPLAIRGYDPVAYFTVGKPVPGLADVEYEWDERRYRFARPEHRELFKADPMRYAPQFAKFQIAQMLYTNPYSRAENGQNQPQRTAGRPQQKKT